MRSCIVRLLAAVLIGTSGVANASYIYNVNLTGGGEALTGTITTDVNSGVLAATDILAWKFIWAGSIALSIAGTSAQCDAIGCGLTATPDHLLFDFGLPFIERISFPRYDPTKPSVGFFSDQFNNNGVQIGLIAGWTGTGMAEIDFPLASVAVASAPEPATVTLFGLALAGVGFSRRWLWRRQPAAAWLPTGAPAPI